MNKKLSRLIQPSPLIFFLILGAFAIACFAMHQFYLGLIAVASFAITLIWVRISRTHQRKALSEFVRSAAQSPEAYDSMPFASALVIPHNGQVVWYNEQFAQLSGITERMKAYYFSDFFDGATLDWLKDGQSECELPIVHDGHRYRIFGSLIRSGEDPDTALAAIYLLDQTQLLLLKDEYLASRPIVCVILVDNYDELTNNLPDSNVSNLNAAIDTRIKYWTDGIGGLLRKVERNRYLFLIEAKDLSIITERKFQILESIRAITNPRGIHATISLGIGKDGADFSEGYTFANLAIEMALARGGDQAVIKDRYDFSFFGGRNQETERRTKVKSRVMASSLSELIMQSSHIFIMGHKNADLDSVGAACGIVCICRKLGKRPLIVIDREKNASGILLEKLDRQPEYRGCFISGQDALLMADPKSLLIVVDTNRPDQTECKPLLECVRRVCVVDHHRRAADYIDDVVLNMHDPSASSASELAAELLQYATEPADLLAAEAQAMLSGIVLDTKNFTMRTSSRTFEAAAFLRRLGADTVDVKLLLQSDKESTMQRYSIIQKAQTYRNSISIAALDSPVSRIVAAQAADELLNIVGITTSVVLYPDPIQEQVIISARSFGDTNVQMILEPLGGGGNAAIAGAQVKGKTVDEVFKDLTSSIDRYFEVS